MFLKHFKLEVLHTPVAERGVDLFVGFNLKPLSLLFRLQRPIPLLVMLAGKLCEALLLPLEVFSELLFSFLKLEEGFLGGEHLLLVEEAGSLLDDFSDYAFSLLDAIIETLFVIIEFDVVLK